MWLWAWIVGMGCGGDGQEPDTDPADTDPVVDTDADTDPPAPEWPARVALAYAVAGDTPAGTLRVPAGDGPLTFDVPAPFRLVDPPARLGPDPVDVRIEADLASGWAQGVLRVTGDGAPVEIAVAAIVGDPALPAATWTTDAWGAHTTARLPHAPFPDGSAPWTDDRVFLAVPPRPRGPATGTVTHLHGHNATLAEIVALHHLPEQLALSGRDALLVVPQGPVEAASGNFGKVDDPGGHLALVADAWAVAYRDGAVDWPAPVDHAVTCHSGGYLATAAILRAGGLDVAAAHLFDAMYGERATFVGAAEDGVVLRSDYTTSGGTVTQNELAADELAAAGVSVGDTLDDDALEADLVTIAWTPASHMAAPTVERVWARTLAASPLARRPGAAPELRAIVPTGDGARVTWRADGAPAAWVVEADDGAGWAAIAHTTALTAEVPWHAAIRVRADVDGAEPSDVYGATGAGWLVVDGFDRVLDGSWTAPSHDFASRLGRALGAPFATACDEAVARGDVDLSDYDGVLWLLGDESTNDVPLSDAAADALLAYVDGGGPVIVSGSELGYADPSLLAALGGRYVADDAASDTAGGYRFGVVYPEDYPDVLDGPLVLWRYGTGGGAAVRADNVTIVGFALETMTDGVLAEALPALVE